MFYVIKPIFFSLFIGLQIISVSACNSEVTEKDSRTADTASSQEKHQAYAPSAIEQQQLEQELGKVAKNAGAAAREGIGTLRKVLRDLGSEKKQYSTSMIEKDNTIDKI